MECDIDSYLWECNQIADWLSKYESTPSLGFHVFDNLSRRIRELLLNDINGANFRRVCNM